MKKNDVDVIPPDWNLNVDDVVFLGKNTIQQMIQYWRGNINDLTEQIQEINQKVEFLKNKDAQEIQKIAKSYESPKFPYIGIPKGSRLKNPEPLDIASIHRKHDATTFNFCGWCKYAGTGACRYEYHITTSCTFKTDAGFQDKERYFNSPCFLKETSTQVFDKIRQGLQQEKKKIHNEILEITEKINFLSELKKSAEKKPVLPNERPYNWFNIGDGIVCYIGSWKEKIVDDNFVTAKVINDYRHHNGCVSVCYSKKIHNGEYLNGRGADYGSLRPEIMHLWEFQYLKKHLDFATLWANQGAEKYLENFDSSQFLKDLANFR